MAFELAVHEESTNEDIVGIKTLLKHQALLFENETSDLDCSL